MTKNHHEDDETDFYDYDDYHTKKRDSHRRQATRTNPKRGWADSDEYDEKDRLDGPSKHRRAVHRAW